MSEINKNLLREPADKLPEVTDEMWNEVNEDYRSLVEEYLSVQDHSPETKKQYKSGLRQFGNYIQQSMNNKPLYKITKRDFLRYMSFLRERGLSSSALNFKKACVSSLLNYIENVVADEDENYAKFRNFTRGLPAIAKNRVYDKVKVTKEEYDLMMDVLESDGNFLGMAWLATAFNVGARRAEIIQFKSEILDYDFPKDKSYILSHIVYGKGRGEGKPLEYMINREAFQYMKLWIEKRGYDHEYIFTTSYGGNPKQMSESWADYFCSDVLSDILGRRVNPHLFKASCITYLLDIKKVPIEIVSKYIAHHEDVSTTIKHYDLRDFEEEKNNIFD